MPVGHPPLFKTVEEIESKIEEYFNQPGLIITITGLALYLGFESRQSLHDYEKRSEFSYIIKRSRLRVENAYEQKLHGNSNAGSIFALKNMNWSDKQEITQTIHGSFSWDKPTYLDDESPSGSATNESNKEQP